MSIFDSNIFDSAIFDTDVNSAPNPVVVNVLVVAPSKTLSLTLTPVVVDVLVITPTVTISGGTNDVWVDTWVATWIDTPAEVFV